MSPSPANQRLADAKAARKVAIPLVEQTSDQLKRARESLQRLDATVSELKQTNAAALRDQVRHALHNGDQNADALLTPEAIEAGNVARRKVEVTEAMATEIRAELPGMESRLAQARDAKSRADTAVKKAALAVLEEEAHRVADKVDGLIAEIEPLRQQLAGAIDILLREEYDATPTGQLYGGGYGATPMQAMDHPKVSRLRERLAVRLAGLGDDEQHANASLQRLNQLIAGPTEE
jgi:archaellum component FlaC